MEITPVHSLTFTGILSESRRIIKSNPSHFLTLSLLFLPLSISLIISPSLHPYLPRHQSPHPTFPPNPHPNNNNNFPSLHHFIYLLLISTLTLIATSLITHSSHHTFLNNLTTLTNSVTTLNSLTNSLFPLAFTAFLSHALMFLASFTFLILVGLFFMLAQTLGLSFFIDYNSIYFTLFYALITLLLAVLMVCFYVNWLLAYVVVVNESKWGVSALVRSAYLVNGMRLVALKLLLFYGVLGGVLVTVYSSTVVGYGLGSRAFWLNVMFGSGFLMLLMMQSCVANVVLYNYCKAVHGELVIEVGDGFGFEYVGLGVDDEKVPHVVTVITA